MSRLITGDKRYIASGREVLPASPNPFYVEIEPQLSFALLIPSKEEASLLDFFYTTKRISGYSQESYDALLRRMPDDIKALANQERQDDTTIGVLEMDFIDFLLNYSGNRALSVVGHIGVGKTTFVKYVLKNIRSRCQLLKKFLPIIVDCLTTSTSPNHADILRMINSAVESATKNDLEEVEITLDNLSNKYDQIINGPRDISLSSILDYIDFFYKNLANKFEPIIVFDNVDQLSSDSVSFILDISRAIFYENNTPVIISMRPPTYRTCWEQSHEKGSFQRYLIRVTPPDIREIIKRRLRLAFNKYQSDKKEIVFQSKRLVFPNIEENVNEIINKILQPDIQVNLINGITNHNIRKSLSAFHRFLQYSKLNFKFLFPTTTNSEVLTRDEESQHFSDENKYINDHLLDGIMHGSDKYYYEKENSIVANILVFDPPFDEPKYLLIYRILSLLDWSGKFIENHRLTRWINSYNYNPDLIEEVLSHLLRRWLIYSPETEREAKKAQFFTISDSGKYYLHYLLNSRQYLYNVVYNIPLRHALWKGSDYFHIRLNSIYELLSVILQEESKQIKYVMKNFEDKYPEPLRSLLARGLLVRNLISPAQIILNGGLKSKNESVSKAAIEYEPKFKALEIEVERLEKELNTFFESSVKLDHKIVTVNIKVPLELGDSSRSFIKAPLTLDRIKNIIEIQLDMREKIDDKPIVVFWESKNSKLRISDFIELKREPDGIYKGELTLEINNDELNLPPFSAMFFCGHKLITTVCVPEPEKYKEA